MSNGSWLPRCILRNQPISLEQSKTAKFERAVHEDCYVSLPLLPKKVPTTVSLVPKKPRTRAQVRSSQSFLADDAFW